MLRPLSRGAYLQNKPLTMSFPQLVRPWHVRWQCKTEASAKFELSYNDFLNTLHHIFGHVCSYLTIHTKQWQIIYIIFFVFIYQNLVISCETKCYFSWCKWFVCGENMIQPQSDPTAGSISAQHQISIGYVSSVLRLQYSFAPPSSNPHQLHFESTTVQCGRKLALRDSGVAAIITWSLATTVINTQPEDTGPGLTAHCTKTQIHDLFTDLGKTGSYL